MSIFLQWGKWTDLKGKTNVAPAAVASVAGHDVVVARTDTDGVVYVKRHTRDKGFTDWSEVPPTTAQGSKFETQLGPGAGAIGHELILYAIAADNSIHYNTTPDGVTWSGWTPVSGSRKTNKPVGVGPNGSAYITGLDNQVYVNANPKSGSWETVPGTAPDGTQFKSGSAVCVGSFKSDGKSDVIGLLCKGYSDQNTYFLFPPGASQWSLLGGEGATEHALAAARRETADGSWLFMVGVGLIPGLIADTVASPDPNAVYEWSEILPLLGGELKVSTDAPVAVAAPIVSYPDGSTSQNVFLFAKSGEASTVWVNIAEVLSISEAGL